MLLSAASCSILNKPGVHSGDSACVVPPYKISYFHVDIIRDYTWRIGNALQIKGLFNIQFAIKDDEVYVLEVNPRASPHGAVYQQGHWASTGALRRADCGWQNTAGG